MRGKNREEKREKKRKKREGRKKKRVRQGGASWDVIFFSFKVGCEIQVESRKRSQGKTRKQVSFYWWES